MIKQNQKLVNKGLVIVDALVIIAAFLLTWYIRIHSGIMEVEGGFLSFEEYLIPVLIMIPVYLIIYNFKRLYNTERMVFLSKEINLSNSDEPAIIFGKNITINGNEEQRKLAHILAYGTLNIDNGGEFIGGLNANKLNYTFTTDNTKQRIITSKDLTGGECRKCSEIQKAETNAFRLSQISGQNACEQIILQLEKYPTRDIFKHIWKKRSI